MTNPFGIEHESLAKSFVPGVGFKAATKLDTTERHIVSNFTRGNRAARLVGKTPAKPSAQTANKGRGRKINDRSPFNMKRDGKRGLYHLNVDQSVPGPGGKLHPVLGEAFPDGKGGGHIVTYKGGQDAHTFLHESAHLRPKRNPVRFHERYGSNPKARGREEGRADFEATGKQTAGQYPGDDDFKSGYNEVQGKMAAAKFRRDLRRR